MFIWIKYSTVLSGKEKLSERLVEIPLQRIVRDKIREMKKRKTYSEYLSKLLEDKKWLPV